MTHRFLFSLLLIVLPSQLGFHFWPSWAMVLGRRVDYLAPTIFLTDILIVFILISWIREEKKTIFKINLVVLLVLIFIGLNIYFASSWQVAAYTWVKVLEFGLLGYYIVKTTPPLSFVIFYLSMGIIYSSLIAIAQFFLQRSLGGPLWFLGERTFDRETPGIAKTIWCQGINVSGCQEILRAYGTFPHPNVLGGYLAVLLPVILKFSNYPILKLSNRTYYIITTVVGVIALVLTFSRSAWISFVIGYSLFVIRFWKKKQLFLLVGIAVVIFFVIMRSFSLTDESVVVRQELNNAAIAQWRQSPLFGVGLGNFLVELPKTLPTRTIYFLQPVHNIYLLLLSEVGIMGVGLIFFFLYKLFKRTFHPLSTIHYPLFTILLLGLVDHYPLTLQQGRLLFTIFLSLSMIQ